MSTAPAPQPSGNGQSVEHDYGDAPEPEGPPREKPKRVELFAREHRDGFQAWGDEVDKFKLPPLLESKSATVADLDVTSLTWCKPPIRETVA
jgi:hypothetical protein